MTNCYCISTDLKSVSEHFLIQNVSQICSATTKQHTIQKKDSSKK